MKRDPSIVFKPIEECDPDTAVLVYAGCLYEVAHYNTVLGKWVACYDHRPIPTPVGYVLLPLEPHRR